MRLVIGTLVKINRSDGLPSSTISPANTLAIPDIAMTTFCDTEQPVIVCIKRLTAAFGNAARLYISYRSNCSSVKLETKTLHKIKSNQIYFQTHFDIKVCPLIENIKFNKNLLHFLSFLLLQLLFRFNFFSLQPIPFLLIIFQVFFQFLFRIPFRVSPWPRQYNIFIK